MFNNTKNRINKIIWKDENKEIVIEWEWERESVKREEKKEFFERDWKIEINNIAKIKRDKIKTNDIAFLYMIYTHIIF